MAGRVESPAFSLVVSDPQERLNMAIDIANLALQGVESAKKHAVDQIRKAVFLVANPVKDTLPPQINVSESSLRGSISHVTIYEPRTNTLSELTFNHAFTNGKRLVDSRVLGDEAWLEHGRKIVVEVGSMATKKASVPQS